MSNRSVINRPFKFGERDRREFIVQDSEVALVAINDDDGDPVFLGRSKVGTPLSEEKWQIRKVTYDTTGGVVRVQWPENNEGVASSEYEFSWSSDASLTISGITKANPGVVTVTSIGTLQNGDLVVITGVEGMEEVNFDGSNIYTVAGISGNTFQLQGINTSAFGAYVSGGTVSFGDFLNYTYA